jgi:hypothetical protein
LDPTQEYGEERTIMGESEDATTQPPTDADQPQATTSSSATTGPSPDEVFHGDEAPQPSPGGGTPQPSPGSDSGDETDETDEPDEPPPGEVFHG